MDNREVDWNRDGTYSEVTEYVAELSGSSGFSVSASPTRAQHQRPTLHLTLNNADKRFSPENRTAMARCMGKLGAIAPDDA